MKEISPQHGENGRKSAILGVRGRKIFQPGCWIRRQGRRMFQPGCLWPRWCSGCRRARPGPATAHRHRGRSLRALRVSGAWALIGGSIRRPETQLWLSTSNFACNSPTILSNSEIKSLELQRFQTLLKLRPIELHAIFRFLLACRSLARWRGPAVVSAMLHVIRLRLFQTVNPRRWNFNVSGLLLRVGAIELRATFPGVVTAVTR